MSVYEIKDWRLLAQHETVLLSAQWLKPNSWAKTWWRQSLKIPLINFYYSKMMFFKPFISFLLKRLSSINPIAFMFLVFYACRGRSWFDWIQTRLSLQRWNFSHKCKCAWWEPYWEGKSHYRSMVKNPPRSTPSPQPETDGTPHSPPLHQCLRQSRRSFSQKSYGYNYNYAFGV